MKRGDFLRGLVRELASARGDCAPGSFMNCHAVGLHSIVLRERPMVRLFVTTPEHELWRTFGGVPSTIAFHSHRTDLTLETVSGEFFNWMLDFDEPSMGFRIEPAAYVWDSKIKGGAGRFSMLPDPPRTGWTVAHRMSDGDVATMGAAELHTVEVERCKRAAWLVTEGREDPHYKPVSWSTRDLTAFDSTGLYRSMTTAEAADLLSCGSRDK